MIKQIRTNKFTKTVACYLAIMIFLEMTQPMVMMALTGGPSQPEFESFTPIGTSDMVNLSSGDFNYNIPIMDVGGYPLNLAYNSTVTMDQEASWVGLGWDLNVGQITRQLRGLPDDFNGDQMIYENNMKENVTIGANANIFTGLFGVKEEGPKIGNLSAGLGVKYNNYDGFSCSINGGLSFDISANLTVGMDMESSATEGVTVMPHASFDRKFGKTTTSMYNMGTSLGVSYNSRKGLESMSMSFIAQKEIGEKKTLKNDPSLSGSVSFVDASYTPTKRVGMISNNFTFNLNIGGAFWGIEPGFKFSGYRTSQGIKNSERYKIEKAYGFENTYNAGESDILDFNREKDKSFDKNTTALPITNNTYDLYSIQGQGVSGMFRPYKSQVGYVYDNSMRDDSDGGSLGMEFAVGGGTHWGFDASITLGKSSTSVWKDGNPALGRFMEKKGVNPDYEKVYFKNIGGTQADADSGIFNNQLGGYEPIKLQLSGGKFSRTTKLEYFKKKEAVVINGTGYIARTNRAKRGQAIQKLTRAEAVKYNSGTIISPHAKAGKQDHHTAEIRVTKDGGERYVYGRAVYNIVKKEATFDVGKNVPDCTKGLVRYNAGKDNSTDNNQSGDQFFNRITTPSYAHSYLLTSVLSPDYQDTDDKAGPTDGDLGNYTKFTYENKTANNPYKWRIPFEKNLASYDEGLRSSEKDNKGNYQYGEKELLYIKKIETKTHVAIFTISPRHDAHGVKDENGGLGTESVMYKLDKISLYSKPEYLANSSTAVPIKEAHFKYGYSLCPGLTNTTKTELAETGKLTLERVYFTYKKSNMGKFTPYVFNYGDLNDRDNNPEYNLKAYDMWGNYKPVDAMVGCGTFSALTNAEFPYVNQNDSGLANKHAAAWLLKSVRLPSGGNMQVNYESDDYSSVQNRDVMQMFKVVGAGTESTLNPSAANMLTDQTSYNTLYSKNIANPNSKYVYIKLNGIIDDLKFWDKYVRPLEDKPVYFRFLLNMAKDKDKYDFVTGYFNIDKNLKSEAHVFSDSNGNNYASIPVKMVNQGGNGGTANPISKAGWYFGRNNLNRTVFDMENEEDTNNLEGVVKQLIGSVAELLRIFDSPNQVLRDSKIASKFIKDKSWIRLMQPNGEKIGGGSRVNEIRIYDEWNVMTNSGPSNGQSYGQTYSYDLENGVSSGVATYEPVGTKENPFVEPFYNNTPGSEGSDVLLAPDHNYVEKPLGESFFPAPTITYAKVTVKNLPRYKKVDNVAHVVLKHATGKVVTEFFTSKDYPTIADYTLLSSSRDNSTVLASILSLDVKNHLTFSQGYSIHTNDMDGKIKSQSVYGEGKAGFVSGETYVYKDLANPTDKNAGKLDNNILTVDASGNIKKNTVGVDYDVVNDFRENKSVTETAGIHFNIAGLPLLFVFLVVPVPLPSYSKHTGINRMAVTTKVIHTTGILSEKIVQSDGAKVSTKNLAWDADTGEVILTETANEFNDKYYSFNFPAYWSYKEMGLASKNLGIEWGIQSNGNTFRMVGPTGTPIANATPYIVNGDEVLLSGYDNSLPRPLKKNLTAWIVKVQNGNSFKLIDKKGMLVKQEEFNKGSMKIVRSGYRNLHTASMASVTAMKNPLAGYNPVSNSGVIDAKPFLTVAGSSTINANVLNASAIEYSNLWPAQCECNLPKMQYSSNNIPVFEYELNSTDEEYKIEARAINPYLYNILGNWRANKSYAYLTGRTAADNATPRSTGFYNDFTPFYVLNGNTWSKTGLANDLKKWTFASEVSQFSPYGHEVENKDALERYSSALYGYNNRFPTAVASNTKYSEIAFDGFEDYDFSTCGTKSHFNFEETLLTDKILVTSNQSHTGRRSLKLMPAKAGKPNAALIKKQVVSCKTIESNGAKTTTPVKTPVKQITIKTETSSKVSKK